MKWFPLLFWFLSLSFWAEAQSGSLQVTVSEIVAAKGGELSLGIFQKAGFPEMGKQKMGKWVPIKSEVQTVLIEDLPVGTYGLAVFQDLNGNRRLNKNLFGYPSEPFGFSNDAKVVLGPPDFEDAAVQVTEGKVTAVSIRLR